MDTAQQVTLNPLTFIPGCNTPGDVTMAQLRANVERDIPWLELEPLKDRPLAIVAGGPSLKQRWHELYDEGVDVLALNNAYPYLTNKGIFPKYFMLLDARRENVDFLRQKCPLTRHYIAAQCHPAVFDALKGMDARLYLTILPGALEAVEHIDKPKHRIAGTVGTVGIKAMCLAYALGYRKLRLYGYDSSYADDDDAHHAFPQKLNDDAKTIDVYLDGKRYVTTPTLAHQVSEFCKMAGDMTRSHGFDIRMHCDGLLPDMVKHANARGEIPLDVREAEKYTEMWRHDAYRKTAPGTFHVKHAIDSLGIKKGAKVIDFGCGTGRAAQAFHDSGYAVTGVDFATGCRDAGCTFEFVQACLWDLPGMYAPYGFCTDVMEHIPTEKVEDVLRSISARVRDCYFNISTTDDSLGSLIGKKLHLTVMAPEDWQKILLRYWREVHVYAAESAAVFVCKQSTT